MADKQQLNTLKQGEENKCNVEKHRRVMLTPYNTKLDNTGREVTKERAVNPMAIRPEGARVTITDVKPSVNIIKKLFGF
jgi:hypothetical protein